MRIVSSKPVRERYASSVDDWFDRLTSGRHSGVHVDASHDRAVLHGLIDLAPPGIDELAAVIEVVDMVESSPNSLVVMDTAPTGHALRLLEMPALVHDWTKVLMSILLKYQAVASLEEFGPVLLRLSQGLGRLRRLLADADRTSFVAVTRGAELATAGNDRSAAPARGDRHPRVGYHRRMPWGVAVAPDAGPRRRRRDVRSRG